MRLGNRLTLSAAARHLAIATSCVVPCTSGTTSSAPHSTLYVPRYTAQSILLEARFAIEASHDFTFLIDDIGDVPSMA